VAAENLKMYIREIHAYNMYAREIHI